jgi:glycosyltransferase involved in cell wall biosynthesis
MNNPLLSILIPTRNRYGTLIPVIQAITSSLREESYELLIQDNSDDNSEIILFLETLQKDRLTYFYSKKRLSMVENAELAIANSSGKYLCFIGDDDMINSVIIDIVKQMDDLKIYSLIYPIANYFYRDVSFHKKYGFNKPEALSFVKKMSCELEQLNSTDELNRVLHCGGVYILDLPRLYHGVVSRGLMDEIKVKFAKYIPGPCPDMTTSVALATIVKTYYKIKIPLSIAGNSSISEGGKGPTNGHVVKLEDKSWLNKGDLVYWDINIPRIFTRETIWAQSVYHVLSQCLPLSINYHALYNGMIFSCPRKVLGFVNPLFLSQSIPRGIKYYLLLKSYLLRVMRLLLFSLPTFFIELFMKFRGDYEENILVENISSIKSCMEIISDATLKLEGIRQIKK